MQELRRTEISWIIQELKLSAHHHRESANDPSLEGLAAGLHALRAEQIESIADRLQRAFDNGDKRIAIK